MSDNTPDGATPLDPDEADHLIPQHIRTREELNAWEQTNILVAAEWVERARRPALDEATIRDLHRRMFDRTWNWAGQYRRTDKNIGIYWAEIPVAVRDIVEDGRYWLDHGTYPVQEAALRLHHRLTRIHPFPNGNGRHARLWCDLLLRQRGMRPFTWRAEELDHVSDARHRYIDALRQADQQNFEALCALFLRD